MKILIRTLFSILVVLTTMQSNQAQCPDFLNNASITSCPNFECDVCLNSPIDWMLDEPNMPEGFWSWYLSDIPNFDPLTQGMLWSSGMSSASAAECDFCPQIEAIYIDACATPEGDNEFMVVSSGSGFYVDNITMEYDMDNTTGFSTASVNIGDACDWTNGDISDFSGCGDLIAAGPGDFIPANSLVIMQTSITASYVYDISSLCGQSQCIYVISSSCNRGNSGAFSNCDTNGDKVSQVNLLSCACNSTITHNGDDPGCINSNGTFIMNDGTYGNNGCPSGPNINFNPVPLTPYMISGSGGMPFANYSCGTTVYAVGILESNSFNEECCGPNMTQYYQFNINCATAMIDQSSNGELCYGDCTTIKFFFSDGEEPYNLNLTFTISGLSISIPFSVPGFAADDGIQVCYDGTGLSPSFDAGNSILHIPEIAGGFSGDFTLVGFTDATGCAGTVNGNSFSLNFLETPEAQNAILELCDEGGASANFDLTQAEPNINGGSDLTYNYYTDITLANEVFSPYNTQSTTLYVTVSNDDCTSDPAELDLVVIENGDAGMIAIACSPDGDPNCTICNTDGMPGGTVTIYFFFEEAISYDVTVNYGGINYNGTLMGPLDQVDFDITGATTFTVTSVTAEGDCPDETDLGFPVNVTITEQPDINPYDPIEVCMSYTLPPIIGSNLSGSETYNTEADQSGDIYNEGDIIIEDITLYVTSGNEGCEDLELVVIDILESPVYDEPNDTTSCSSFVLPEITGDNVLSGASYFSQPNGNGDNFPPGSTVLSSGTFYIYDPDTDCSGNDPSFVLTIADVPQIEEPTSVNTCGFYILPEIEGQFLSGDEAYYDEMSAEGTMYMVGDTIFTTDTLYIYDINEGCEDEELLSIILDDGPTAGVGDTIAFCKIDTLTISLPDLLIIPADTLGDWTDDMGILQVDSDSTMVVLDDFTGVVNFMYVIENIQCGNDTSHLQITVVDQPVAGEDNELTECSMGTLAPIDIPDLLNITDPSGIYINVDGATVNLSDPSQVDITSLVPGDYDILYIIEQDTICQSDTATLTLHITPQQSAGDSGVTATVCKGSTVDLATILVNQTTIGTFSDPNGHGGLSGSIVDTDVLDPGNYSYTHTIFTDQPCSVTSLSVDIAIEVSNEVTAGPDIIDTLCSTGEVLLFDLLDPSASSGGTFYFTSDNSVIVGGILNASVQGDYEIGYQVGDDVTCPIDSAILELFIQPDPVLELSLDLDEVCIPDVVELEYGYVYTSGVSLYLQFYNNVDTLYIENVDLDESFDLLYYDIMTGDDSEFQFLTGAWHYARYTRVTTEDCEYLISDVIDSFYIMPTDTFTIDQTLCEDETITVNGVVYDIDIPTGTEIIPRPGACDSIVMIDLDYLLHSVTLIEQTLCFGQSYTVTAGVVFDESTPTGSYTFDSGAANGCDSTVMVNLSYAEASINDIMDELCIGTSIDINGTIYDEDNLMGSDTLFGASAGGCDSIINVQLTPISPVTASISETTCDITYSIEVNEVIYNIDNPSGMETLVGMASNGCDSIVEIALTILPPGVENISESICDDESIIVNGVVYDADLLSGIETLPGMASNGCDSIINVSLQLLDTPEGDFINSGCDENYSITINGNTYDINNPMGTELIPTGAANGCDSIANIQLTFDGITAEYSTISPPCPEDDMGQVSIDMIGGTAPWNYILDGEVTTINMLPADIAVPIGSGEIEIIDADGCEVLLSYDIEVTSGPNLSYSTDGQQIIINGIDELDITNIIWSPAEGLSCTGCIDPTYTITEDMTYTLTITYGEGCMASIDVDVPGEEIILTPDYNVPNIFSPNGDGNNEIFFVLPNNVGGTQVKTMAIYDRWGSLLYLQENYTASRDIGWDGTFNGTDVNPGVYVYFIEIIEGEEIKTLIGDVTLVR